MAESFQSPDVRLLREEDLPEAGFPVPRSADFRVYFETDVHRRIAEHVNGDTSVEVGGVLVGKWLRDDDGPFVLISQFVACDSGEGKVAEITFTHDAWAKIHEQMDTTFSELSIVGWYHSHPGFGIFLSDRDQFIQEHFFSNPGQVAYVVDPLREIEGVFVWENGRSTLARHYWVGKQIHLAPEAGGSKSKTAIRPTEPTSTASPSSGRCCAPATKSCSERPSWNSL